jgi:hypothetical protein
MRALLLLIAAAFDADLTTDGAPTFDPEELEISLLDEYETDDGMPEKRFLQYLVNATNSTGGESVLEDIPWLPLALVGLGGAGAAGYFMTRPGEGYDYDHADDGLLSDEEYGSDEEYSDDE